MKRTQRIIVSIVLIILGLALLAATGIYFLDKITADKPTGLGTEILGVIAALTSLASLVIGILTVRKKDQPAGKTELNVTGDSPQVTTGENARPIQTGTYIEKQFIESPTTPTLSAIPHQLRPPMPTSPGAKRKSTPSPAIFAKASPSPACRAWAGSARPPWAWSLPTS